jgi:hypothetical protein
VIQGRTREAAHAASPSTSARELFCTGCGYGIVVRGPAPECPMCRGSGWRERPPRSRWN